MSTATTFNTHAPPPSSSAVAGTPGYGSRLGKEIGDNFSAMGDGAKKVGNSFVNAAEGVGDAARSPAWNPVFASLAAIGAFLIGSKFTSMLSASRDSTMGKWSVGAVGLAGSIALAVTAFSAVGALQDDPQRDMRIMAENQAALNEAHVQNKVLDAGTGLAP